MDGEVPLEPDSTTAERELAVKEFSVNDDVLCNISRDNQLYLGVVVQVNQVLKKCLVKFLDETETWCCFRNMKLFLLGEPAVACVVCKSSQPSIGNCLKVCGCGRGYHQQCHIPSIDSDSDTDWKCKICQPTRKRDERQAKQTPLVVQREEQQSCMQCNVETLWYQGMLQCRRCRKWQHGRCLRMRKKLALHGDRFFIFVCAGCNRGKEICYRLTLTWPDLVHLVLYNINLDNPAKYHDLDEVVMPFLNRVWPNLQLPYVMTDLSKSSRRRKVESTLQNHPKRFCCGREVKKKTSLWSLRVRVPPRTPSISLPRGALDEDTPAIKQLIANTEPPLQNRRINSSRKVETDDSGSSTSSEIKVESSSEFLGEGLVKRSVPFPMTESASNADARFRSQAVRRAARVLRRKKCKERRPSPRLSDSEDEALRSLDHDPARSIEDFLSKFKDPPKRETRKRPQRNLLEARLNSTESKLYNASAPATPPPEPPKKLKKGETVKSTKQSKSLIQKTSSETPSRRQEDAIASLDEGNSVSAPPPQPAVIVKRKLSLKDLNKVSENGKGVLVKRGRRLRSLSGVKAIVKPAPQPDVPAPVDWSFLLTEPIDANMAAAALVCTRTRIDKGEHYQVTARRILPNGDVDIKVRFLDKPS